MIPFALTVKLGRYPKRTYQNTFISRARCALFCTAPAPSPRHVRWGGRYFQQFFGAMPAEAGLLGAPPCLKLRRIKNLPVTATPQRGRAVVAASQPRTTHCLLSEP